MKVIFLLLFFILTSTAMAAAPTELPLRGQGHYKWFLLSVYEAKLWGEKTGELYSKALLLELKYSRSFTGKDIVEQSIKELSNSGASKVELEQWKVKLLEIFPNVKDGDAIQASFEPGKGIVFFLNSSHELGRVSDLNLSKKFLDIWLGEKTSAPELRNKLLGS